MKMTFEKFLGIKETPSRKTKLSLQKLRKIMTSKRHAAIEQLAIRLVQGQQDLYSKKITIAESQKLIAEIQKEAYRWNASPNEVLTLAQQNQEIYKKLIKP